MSWLDEFGPAYDVPAEIIGLEGIEDQSWHNDTAPRFGLYQDGVEISLWSDHPDPDERECRAGDVGGRFVVTLYRDCAPEALYYEGDDVSAAVRAFMTALPDYHRMVKEGA